MIESNLGQAFQKSGPRPVIFSFKFLNCRVRNKDTAKTVRNPAPTSPLAGQGLLMSGFRTNYHGRCITGRQFIATRILSRVLQGSQEDCRKATASACKSDLPCHPFGLLPDCSLDESGKSKQKQAGDKENNRSSGKGSIAHPPQATACRDTETWDSLVCWLSWLSSQVAFCVDTASMYICGILWFSMYTYNVSVFEAGISGVVPFRANVVPCCAKRHTAYLAKSARMLGRKQLRPLRVYQGPVRSYVKVTERT